MHLTPPFHEEQRKPSKVKLALNETEKLRSHKDLLKQELLKNEQNKSSELKLQMLNH